MCCTWLLLLGALGPTKLVAGGAASILPTGPGARSRPTLVRGGAATATESSPEQAQRNGTQVFSRTLELKLDPQLLLLFYNAINNNNREWLACKNKFAKSNDGIESL